MGGFAVQKPRGSRSVPPGQVQDSQGYKMARGGLSACGQEFVLPQTLDTQTLMPAIPHTSCHLSDRILLAQLIRTELLMERLGGVGARSHVTRLAPENACETLGGGVRRMCCG